MINKVSSDCGNCTNFFITKNPEIGVIVSAVIAALGVVLQGYGIGCFAQNCAISVTGFTSFVIFTLLTFNKYCLMTNKVPEIQMGADKKQSNLSEPVVPPISNIASKTETPALVATPPALPASSPTVPPESNAPSKPEAPSIAPATSQTVPAAKNEYIVKQRAHVTKLTKYRSGYTTSPLLDSASRNATMGFALMLTQAKKEIGECDSTVWIQKDSYDQNLLHIAASSEIDAKEKVALILQSLAPKAYGKVRQNLLTACDKKGMTPLHRALEPDTIETLFDAGANLEAQDSEGRTPFLLFLKSRERSCIEKTLDLGAKVDVADKAGKTSLMIPCQVGNDEQLALILNALSERVSEDARKAFINRQDNSDRQTALHFAARNGNWNCIDMLLTAGADPSLKDKTGKTYKDIAEVRLKEVREALAVRYRLKPKDFTIKGSLSAKVTDAKPQEGDGVLLYEADCAFKIAEKLGLS